MKLLPPLALVRPLSVLVLLTLSSPGCRKHRPPERVSIEQLKVEIAPELESNQLGALKGAVFEAYAASPIHWQPLEPRIFQQSDASKRLILCVIARPASPACHALMRELESDPQTVADINHHYIPVLIDADVATEYALLGAMLSDEINRRLAFPVLTWVNSSKHVLASTPVSPGQPGGIIQVFSQSHAMISPMWKDDLEKWQADGSPGYIIENSAHDHKRRIEQIASRRAETRLSGQPREDLPQAIHRLALQYDAYVQNFSTAGAAVPTEALRLLAEAARCEGLDPSIRAQSKQVVASLSSQLMASPMIDPLDGGCFSYRAGQSWKLPVFLKDCATQAELARALLLGHQVTGDPRALDVATGLIHFAELNFRTEQGLFAQGAAEDQQPAKWTWTIEEIQELLGEQDARWWVRAMGMEELGNVPIELDASRNLLRKNALALTQGSAETARALSMSPDDFQNRFDAARRKLGQIRSDRWRNLHVDRSPHLESSLRMVMAYVVAYQVTGAEEWRGKAVNLMKACRDLFVVKGELLPYGMTGEASLVSARARHHALEALASLTLDEIAPAPENNARVAAALAALADRHLADGVLWECQAVGRLMDLPLEHHDMRLGVSSVGLLSQVSARCDQHGIRLPETLRPVAEALPVSVLVEPLPYCDRLSGTLQRCYNTARKPD